MEDYVRLQQLDLTQRGGSSAEQGLTIITSVGTIVTHQWSSQPDIDSTIKQGLKSSGAHQETCTVMLL